MTFGSQTSNIIKPPLQIISTVTISGASGKDHSAAAYPLGSIITSVSLSLMDGIKPLLNNSRSLPDPQYPTRIFCLNPIKQDVRVGHLRAAYQHLFNGLVVRKPKLNGKSQVVQMILVSPVSSPKTLPQHRQRDKINKRGDILALHIAVQQVVGAATHAFVSKDWSIETEGISEVSISLGQSSANVVDAIDSFFGALRIATGITTGYAQILWVPKHWALSYFCDLTPVYGTTVRQYPSDFDKYAWTRQAPTVTAESLNEVRRVYKAIAINKSEAIRLAIKQLNGCLTRADGADAILDGTIGLELLLGDDQNQALSYKLRLRAGALAILCDDPNYRAIGIASKVKELYKARSSIVHGTTKSRSKNASDPTEIQYADERMTASDLLRFVLDMLLTHPEYLEPSKIDEDILLRSAKSETEG
jgi:hypothetical protein